jgi:hypothetical protein
LIKREDEVNFLTLSCTLALTLMVKDRFENKEEEDI